MLLQRYGWARRPLPRHCLLQQSYGRGLYHVPYLVVAYNGTAGPATSNNKAGGLAVYKAAAALPAPGKTQMGAMLRKMVRLSATPRTTNQAGENKDGREWCGFKK